MKCLDNIAMLFIGKRLISDIPKINIYVSVELKWATLTEPQFRPSSLGFRRWFVPFYWRDLQTKHWERCRVLWVLYCQQNNILRGVVTNGFFPLLEEENVLKRKGKKILSVCVCVWTSERRCKERLTNDTTQYFNTAAVVLSQQFLLCC